MPRTEILQYDIAHDRKEKDAQFIAKQLETHLRERFNVLISSTEYGINNGHLVRQGTEEPFIESVKRGRDFIQKLSPNPVDIERENAEVVGFEKIDTFLSNPATSLGSKMLSISPEGEEGSRYKHNFYDIFTLKEKNGKKYVELSRYSSGLTPNDYVNRLGLKFRYPQQEYPIEYDARITPEAIHRALHEEHKYMDPSVFEKIWNSPRVQFFVENYELFKDAVSFNAFLNGADEVWERLSRQDAWQFEKYSNTLPSYAEVRFMKEKEVRQTGGQCPGKSGADIDDSPFSVSDFGIDYEFDKAGPCKKCNADVQCGPCGICKACDLAIRASQKPNLN